MAISQDAATRLACIRQTLACATEPCVKTELLEQLPPMDANTQAAVCIPVAASNNIEAETLPYTLDQLQQQIGEVNFEVVLFLNRPQGKAKDQTLAIAQNAQRHMSNLRILEGEIAQGDLTIGYIRGLLHAVVSERARRAAVQDLCHIVIDADMVWLHQRLVEAHYRKLAVTDADACIGQLDWDHPVLPTRQIPSLIVGSTLMRLLPRYANKHVIETAARGKPVAPSVLEEAVFARNFGRGVLANVSMRDEVYRRVGGYQPLSHGEDYDIMQRIWESGRHRGRYDTLCFGWKKDGIAAASNSRRALWALHAENLPAVKQWDYKGYQGPGDHAQLPDMAAHLWVIPDLASLTRLINESLAAFPLPAELLQSAVVATLRKMGLTAQDYALQLLPADEDTCTAEITITNAEGLLAWLRKQLAP